MKQRFLEREGAVVVCKRHDRNPEVTIALAFFVVEDWHAAPPFPKCAVASHAGQRPARGVCDKPPTARATRGRYRAQETSAPEACSLPAIRTRRCRRALTPGNDVP